MRATWRRCLWLLLALAFGLALAAAGGAIFGPSPALLLAPVLPVLAVAARPL